MTAPGLGASLPIQARDYFVLLVMRRICKRVDVSREASRRGSVYAGDMMVDTNLITCQRPWLVSMHGRRCYGPVLSQT